MSKYSALTAYLCNIKKDAWPATFAEVEDILGFKLPASARKYAAWWSNTPHGHSHAGAWLNAGFETEAVSVGKERVTFRRTGMPTEKLPKAEEAFESGAPHSWDRPESVNASLRYEWRPLGRAHLGPNETLILPKAPDSPGLYRFRIMGAGTETRYVGETANIRRRFHHYCKPGPSQATNLRLNECLSSALRDGAEIGVATVTGTVAVTLNGHEQAHDLSNKAIRRLLENAALASGANAAVESLNR